MRSRMRKLLVGILMLMLMSSDLAVMAEAAALMLPSALQIVDEEAFYQATSIDEVVVPEGTTEIRSRAFAYSSLAQIALPESVEYIADDAFEGCENLTLQVPRDSYAHQWAALSDLDYSISGEESVEDEDYSVWGVSLTVETDDSGEETRYIGAYVTAAEDCMLNLIAFTEDMVQLDCLSVEVPAGTQNEYLQAEYTQELPEYFALEALLTADGVEKSCWEYCHTEAYAQFEAQSPSDFPGEKVLDFGSSGYAVLADGVLALNAAATQSNGGYTFATDTALKTGDIILLDVDGEAEIVKIAGVRDNGDGTVTVAKDSKVYLSEMYDVVNIDGSMVSGVSALSDVGTPVQVFSADNSISYKDVLELSYHAEMTINVSFKFDKGIFKDGQLKVIMETAADFTGTLGGQIDTFKDTLANGGEHPLAIQLYNDVVILPGISFPAHLNVSVPVNLKADVGGELTFGYQNSYGFLWSGGEVTSYKQEGPRDADIRLKGDFELSIGPEVSLSMELLEALKAKVGAQFGLKGAGSIYVPSLNLTSDESVHACDLCLDMDLYAVANVRATVVYNLWEHLSGSLLDIQVAAYQKKLGEAYCSQLNEVESIFGGEPTFGWDQDCPNYKHRVRVYTENADGETVTGENVSIAGSSTAAGEHSFVEIEPVSGESMLETYLYNGNYVATAAFESGEEKENFSVKDGPINVTVKEAILTISGHVTDSKTGEVVSGADVQLTLSDGAQFSTFTDAEGFYSFGDLYGNRFKFVISANGYITTTRTMTYSDPGTERDIDFDLTPRGKVSVVSGHVTNNATGEPIPGAAVNMTCASGSYSVVTDDEGYYCIDGLNDTSFSFSVSADGYSSVSRNLSYDNPADELTVDFELTPNVMLTTVSGHVTDKETGAAISGATVDMTCNGIAYSAATDDEGYYCFDGLSEWSASISLNVSADRYQSAFRVSTNVGGKAELIEDFELTPLATNISGVVTDGESGEAISGATVTVALSDGTSVSATTDAEGLYSFENLSGTSFAFTVIADGYETGEGSLEISGAETEYTKDFALTPVPKAPSVVPFAASKATVDGDSVIFSMGYTGLNYTSGKGEVAYNFKGEYASMSFLAGYYSGDERDVSMTITADGTVLYDHVTIACDAAAQSFTIPLTGVEQLIICFESDVYDTTNYAISSIRLTPAGNVSDEILVSDEDFTACFSSSKYGYSTTDTFSMGGYTYQSGYMLYMGYIASGDQSWITFNFNGEHSKLSFDIAKYMNRNPESYLRSALLTIEADGVAVGEYNQKELKWNDISLPVEVDLTGVSQLTIRLNSAGYDRVYWAIGDFHLE